MTERESFIVKLDLDDLSSAMRKSGSINNGACFVENNLKQDPIKNKSKWYFLCDNGSHYCNLLILGFLSWGILWCNFGTGWNWNGPWCRLAAVAALAWFSGELLEGTTSLPPLLAALATGILARHFEYIDMRDHPEIDGFLRKIYPVVILGKGALGWNLGFMRVEWRRLATLGLFPWALEVLTVAICTHFLLGFPWIWGFLLGSFYCSVSCPVVMPNLLRLQATASPARHWPQFLCNVGGVDTALSVVFFGIVYSYGFHPANDTYKIVKAVLTLFAGVGLGVAWGSVAGLLPRRDDAYVASLRVLLVLLGGLFGNYITAKYGWLGTGGVAVLVCNATAAHYWARNSDDSWKLNQNSAATAYRVMWALCEPALFSFTGTYFVLDAKTLELFPICLTILVVCLTVRLATAAATSWGMTLRERLVVCCLWTPKTIVEAVLCPLFLNTLILQGVSHDDSRLEYATDIIRLTVVAIIVTTPAGFLLSKFVVPWLLDTKRRSSVDVVSTQKFKTPSNVSAMKNEDM